MEQQIPPRNLDVDSDQATGPLAERDAEILKLRQRLEFYESFDQVIQENVARAGDLLRDAATMREQAGSSLGVARREMEEHRIAERADFRALLSGLLDDVTTLQGHAERLARNVADALDDLEASLPTTIEVNRLPGFGASPVRPIATRELAETWSPQQLDPTSDELGPEIAATPEGAGSTVQHGEVAEEAFRQEADVVVAEASVPAGNVEPLESGVNDTANTREESIFGPGDERFRMSASSLVDQLLPRQFPDAEPPLPSDDEFPVVPAPDSIPVAQAELPRDYDAPIEAADESGAALSIEDLQSIAPDITTIERSSVQTGPLPGSIDEPPSSPEPEATEPADDVETAVLVHGVPRATMALSLKRYLESLPHVTSVEPREYAEGLLRLNVIGQRPVSIDDLRGWSDGSGFAPVHVREDLVEVRLPS
jgi:hypothetical protein